MKKTLFFLSFALLSVSCNDDDVAPVKETNDAFVTRISKDGLTSMELLCDVEKRLYRLNYYSQGGSLSSYTLYEYGDDGLKELRRYQADDHSLVYRSVYTLDNFGRIIKSENYTKPDFIDDPSSIIEFDYNGSDQLTAREFRTAGNPLYYREEYKYDGDDNLIEQQRTYNPDQDDEYLGALYEFTPDGTLIPSSWKDYIFILGLSGLDDEIRMMFISNLHYKGWFSSGNLSTEGNYETSERVFDEEGNLTSQVVTRKNILHPENPDDVTDMTYDYKKEN